MTTLRLAIRLAWTGTPSGRWRQVSVTVATFLVLLGSLVGLAVVRAAAQADADLVARSPLWSAAESGPLRASARAVVVAGVQVPVVWLEPSPGHEHDPTIVPPGLSALPPPGSAVVSPGLAARGVTPADLGLAAGGVGLGVGDTIGDSGIATRDEGLIYVRPGPGQSLGLGGALLWLDGYDGGSGSRARVPDGWVTAAPLIGLGAALTGAFWFVVVPGLLLQIGAARTLSPVRTRRQQSLARLGISRRRIAVLLALETTALAAPAAAAAALVFVVVVADRQALPWTPAVVKPGGYALPVAWVLATAGLVLAASAIGAATGRHERRVRRPTRRPGRWGIALLLIGWVLVIVARQPDQFLERPYVAGISVILLALPVAVPAVVAMAGAVLGRAGAPAVVLSGRRLRHRAAPMSRPAVMLAALLFVGSASVAVSGMLGDASGRATPSGLSVTAVNWRGTGAEPATARESLRRGTGVDLLPAEVSADGRVTGHVEHCAALGFSSVGGARVCDGGRLAPEFVELVRAATGALLVDGPMSVGAQSATPVEALVVAAEPVSDLELYRDLARYLPGLNPSSLTDSPLLAPPIFRWLLAGWLLATVLLSLAVIRELGDRVLGVVLDGEHLIRLGLRVPEVAAVERWSVFAPLAVGGCLGVISGSLVAFYGTFRRFTDFDPVALASYAGVVGATAVLVVLGVRGSLRAAQQR